MSILTCCPNFDICKAHSNPLVLFSCDDCMTFKMYCQGYEDGAKAMQEELQKDSKESL